MWLARFCGCLLAKANALAIMLFVRWREVAASSKGVVRRPGYEGSTPLALLHVFGLGAGRIWRKDTPGHVTRIKGAVDAVEHPSSSPTVP